MDKQKFTKSFYDWCMENNHQDFLDRWDYELNKCSPKDIGFASNHKIWLKCPRGMHSSRQFSPNNLIHPGRTAKCPECESIGQFLLDNYGEEGIDLYWSSKNDLDPFKIRKGSRTKAWFICQEKDYHGDYLMTVNNFTNGQRCPYCSSTKIHPLDSFAQWCIDNIDRDFLSKYWSERNTLNPFELAKCYERKVYIKCLEHDYHGDYEISCANFIKGKRCPYCSNKKIHPRDSVAAKYPIVLEYWSDKNKVSPYEIAPKSNKKFIFFCKKHGEFEITMCDFIESFYRCPKCSVEAAASSYQVMLENYLNDIGLFHLKEYDCNLKPTNIKTGRVLPYDNEIPDLKLIIEVNGMQHYKVCGLTKMNASHMNVEPEEYLEYQQWKDSLKKNYAINHGYNYLEIPYTAFNKDEDYKKLIDNEIEKITRQQRLNEKTA